MRLVKFLAHAGVASRRASEVLISEGRVTVDGKVCLDPARDVTDANQVVFDGSRLKAAVGERVMYAVNKPKGVISTAHDPGGKPTVVELVNHEERLYPVGRLDQDSTGLILLTNDGDLAQRLTHPSYEVPKTYVVRVGGGRISERDVERLREGIKLDDGKTLPARVRQMGADQLEIVLREGRKRQIRRMCEAIGHPVKDLVRIQLGPIKLGGIPEGGHRRLVEEEMRALRNAPTDPDAPGGVDAPSEPAASAKAPRGLDRRGRPLGRPAKNRGRPD